MLERGWLLPVRHHCWRHVRPPSLERKAGYATNAEKTHARKAADKTTLCGSCKVAEKCRFQMKRARAREDGKCTRCFVRPLKAGLSLCEDCWEYRKKWMERTDYKSRLYKEKKDERVRKEGPALDNLQESGGNTRIEMQPEDDEMTVDDPEADVDDMVVDNAMSGCHTINRMAIDYIVD
ncbi:hypothetical protein PG984_009765 [Apiospora sp. TS-2023a]